MMNDTNIPDWWYGGIPKHMRDGVFRYVQHGILPGGFLTAVMQNNFYEAISRVDEENYYNLKEYRDMLNLLPEACWGSPEKVIKWVAHRGAEGLEE